MRASLLAVLAAQLLVACHGAFVAPVVQAAQRANFTTETPLVVAVATADYLDTIDANWLVARRFHARPQFMVGCLNVACMKPCLAIRRFACYSTADVARSKFELFYYLLEAGFEVLFYDADVHFVSDPLQVTAYGADFVAQRDAHGTDQWMDPTRPGVANNLGSPQVNIGFVFARRTQPLGRQLPFLRYWQQAMHSGADQNAFNIAVYRALGRKPPQFAGPRWPKGCDKLDPNPSGNLSFLMLPERPYVNFMLVDWMSHYSDDRQRDAFARQMVVFHTTCVSGHHKSFYARLYGIAKPAYYSAHGRVLTLGWNTSFNCGSSLNWTDVRLAARAAGAAFMPPRNVYVCGGRAWVNGRDVRAGPRPFHLVFSWRRLQALFHPTPLVDPFYTYYRDRLVASGRNDSGVPTARAAVLRYDQPALPGPPPPSVAQLQCKRPLHEMYGPGCGQHCQ